MCTPPAPNWSQICEAPLFADLVKQQNRREKKEWIHPWCGEENKQTDGLIVFRLCVSPGHTNLPPPPPFLSASRPDQERKPAWIKNKGEREIILQRINYLSNKELALLPWLLRKLYIICFVSGPLGDGATSFKAITDLLSLDMKLQ